jgi:hypothetical protein
MEEGTHGTVVGVHSPCCSPQENFIELIGITREK